MADKSIGIVGKNKSIATFPPEFLSSGEFVGINHAAIWYKTQWAFSVYPFLIEEFQKYFELDRIIGLRLKNPTPEYAKMCKYSQYPNEVLGLMHYIGYDNTKYILPHEIRTEVETAIQGKWDYPYHAKHTGLHLLLLWCLSRGYTEINLFGCNQTVGSVDGQPEFPPEMNSAQASLERLGYTKQIIEDARIFNRKITIWQDYDEWKRNQ